MINHHNTVQLWIYELANLALDKVYLLFLMGDEKWRPWILYEILHLRQHSTLRPFGYQSV